MIDIQLIRDNPEKVRDLSAKKGFQIDVDEVLRCDKKRREAASSMEALRNERNQLIKASKGSKPTEEEIQKSREIRNRVEEAENILRQAEKQFLDIMRSVPNMPDDDVPIGSSEKENKIVKEVGEKTNFTFAPRSHWQIAEAKGWIDKQRASKISGSRFAYIRGWMVQLQFAIINFVIDSLADEKFIEKIIVENNLDMVKSKAFEPILPPAIIKTEVYDAMDRLEPRDDRYRVGDPEDELWLQGSAEHTIGSMFMNEILNEDVLPLRFIGYLTSFRREAGTYGKDTEGIIRMHQFDKLEMECFSTAEQGIAEHHLMVGIQESLVKDLGLPYQVINKCTADIGKPNSRGVDIEVWFPGQNKYLETHSADYMTDYQSRRLKTRVKRSDGRIELIHTNDATAFALGRIMAAIIENYQTEDGGVEVPEVLKKYFRQQED